MSDFYILLNDKTGENRSPAEIEKLKDCLNNILEQHDFRISTIVDRQEVRKIINGEDEIIKKALANSTKTEK